jgi:hypothetical protein
MIQLVAGGPYASGTTPHIGMATWTLAGGSGTVEIDINMDLTTGVNVSNPVNKATVATRPVMDWQSIQIQGTPEQWQLDFWAYCGAALPGASAPCQADPVVLDLLGQIMSLVVLIQRQGVPFATIDGTSHTGLTGNGTIAVSGLIGAVVTVTSTPTWVGVEDGLPDVLFNVGWVNWGAAGRYTAREFITASPMVTSPPIAGVYTSLNYSIPPGVTVTIVELRREF